MFLKALFRFVVFLEISNSIRYYDTWSFFSGWPSPVGGASAYFLLNKVSLWLVGNSQTLPVTMLDFSAIEDELMGELSWTTSDEINNEGWNVQHSSNGFTWKTIDFVPGQVNSDLANNYSFTHEDPVTGLNFYRLEQKDLDGTSSYSEVKTIVISSRGLTIYPNPTTNELFVKGLKDTVPFELASQYGEILETGMLSNRTNSLNVTALQSGIYFLVIDGESFKFNKI